VFVADEVALEGNVETPVEEVDARRWALPFFTIWTGQAFSLLGSRVADFALVWWLTQMSGGSATMLATLSLVAVLPYVLIGPVAGALVDRWFRRRVMIVADSLVAALAAWVGAMAWVGSLQSWHVFLFVFVRSVGGVFHRSAMQAATSLMVPKAQLARISGMNQTLQGALMIAAPPLGALAVSFLSLQAIMGIDLITAAFAVAPLLFTSIREPSSRNEMAQSRPIATLVRDIREGFAYVLSWPGLVILMALAALLNGLINPAFALSPILVTQHFGGGALELGWFDSAWGIGLILGGLTLSVWGGFKRRVYTSLMGLVGMGAALVLVGLVPASIYSLALGSVFVAGLMNTLVNGPFLAIIQETVEPGVQGRVFTTIMSLASLAEPLGMAIAGPVADAFGVQFWFVLGGGVSLLMGVGLRAVPAVVNLEEGRPTG